MGTITARLLLSKGLRLLKGGNWRQTKPHLYGED